MARAAGPGTGGGRGARADGRAGTGFRAASPRRGLRRRSLVMEEAPAGWRPWKALLLEGEADPGVAARLGTFLSTLHASDADIGSAESFDAQRVDPYLRTIQGRHPELAANRRVRRAAARDAAMRRPRRLLAEERPRGRRRPVGDRLGVVHRGDPAFDVAFLLNHLLLKTIHRPQAREGYEACGRAFVDAYDSALDMPYVLGLVGCLMLARSTGSRRPSTSPSRGARPRVLRSRPAQPSSGVARGGVGRSSTVSP